MGPRQVSTADRQKDTLIVEGATPQPSQSVQQTNRAAEFQRTFKPQQRLISGDAGLLQIGTDLGCKRMRCIHNPTECRLGLKGPDDGFWPLQRPDRDPFQSKPGVGTGGRSRDNTHRDLPTMPTQRRCQPWSVPGASQKPDPVLVLVLAKAAALHQDGPRKRWRP